MTVVPWLIKQPDLISESPADVFVFIKNVCKGNYSAYIIQNNDIN